MRWFRAVLILGLAAVRAASAQNAPVTQPLDSGSVVRLIWQQGSPRVGKLLAPLQPSSDSVAYCRYPGPPCGSSSTSGRENRTIADLRRVEVSHGSRAGRGALIGGGVAVAVLGLGRIAFANQDSPAPLTGERLAGAITFVALGAGVGALIGRRSTRWRPAP